MANKLAAAGLLFTVGTALVLIVLWVATSLAAKAPADKVQSLEIRMSKVEAYEAYTMSGVYELAKAAGVVLPPPPSP
jgi:hypothetical protein